MENPKIGDQVIVNLAGIDKLSDKEYAFIENKKLFIVAFKDGKPVIQPEGKEGGLVIDKEDISEF